MTSLNPGMIAPEFSLQNATVQPTAGKTFALSPIPSGDPQGQDLTVDYIENVAPTSVNIDVEAGNSVDANENLISPKIVLATINTPGEKSIMVSTQRFGFVRLNLTILGGPGADVSGKLKR